MKKVFLFFFLMVFTFIASINAANLITNGDFESGLAGWVAPNYADAVTVSAEAANSGTSSMKVAVGDWGGGKYDMQVNSPSFPIISGHKYEISFFIKSNNAGKVALDFPNANLGNQYPWTSGQELVTTSAAWTKVTYNPTTTPDGMVATTDGTITFRLLLGAVANVTYYIDGVTVTDLDDEGQGGGETGGTEGNLFADGGFESGSLGTWSPPYYVSAVTVSTEAANNGTYSMKVAVGDWGGGKHNMQVNSPTFPIIAGHKYEISFFIKSDKAGQVGLDFPNNNLTNQYPWTGGSDLVTTSAAWTKVTYNPTTTPDGMVATVDNAAMNFRLLLGAVVNVTYYIDDVTVIDLDAPTSGIAQTEICKAYVSDNVLYVGDTQMENVSVCDANGRLLIMAHNTSAVNLASLNKGVYIAKIIAGGKTQTLKFVR